MSSTATPVVFIHGLWLHATSWENWLAFFREAGYAPVTPGWPGDPDTVEEARQHPERIAGKSIDEVTDHYARIIRDLDRQPIVIGHSFGGLIAQKLLGQNLAAAAIAIDAAQPKGVLPLPLVQLRSVFPVLRNPANRNRAVSLTAEQFRFGFGNAVSEAESAELYRRWAIPAPGKPLFSGAVANFNPNSSAKVDTANATRGPLLLIAGGRDHTVPPVITRATYRLYRNSSAVTEFKEFADRGHSLALDSGWKDIAEYALAWLKRHSL